ncbi:MAG: hypothetical protein RLY71_7 [Pseudomonadota bacterium]|jgi:heme-degrading monooxygenase HmoA/hemerythrin-like domain-containing protein
MILEVADIRIAPDRQDEFEQAAHHGIQTVTAKSSGFRGYQVRHSIESPERYLLLLEWDTLEDHTVGFRGSAAYTEWRNIVAGFFTQPPVVEHFSATTAMVPTQTSSKDQPIQDFSDCHVGIVTMLDDLTALSSQRIALPQRREVADRIVKFFKDVVTAHHTEEEADLFTAVIADAAAGDERIKVQALVDKLVGEHRRLEQLYSQLAPLLFAIADGDKVSLDASAVAALVTDYRAHAKFEEEVFLPLAQTILGRNSDHMAALGLTLHIRHASQDVRQRYGFI